MNAKVSLSIIIPVYNGELTIGKLVEHVSKLNIQGEHEVILINDGSQDDSLKVCKKLLMNSNLKITLIDLSRNYGEHNAIITGMRHATGQYLITIDDDLQNPPGEIEKLYNYTKNTDYDVVYTFYEKKKDALWRKIGSKFANWTANLVIDKPKDIYLSSFRCMKKIVADEVSKYSGPFPYVDGHIFQITQNIGSIQVEHLPRTTKRSNYTLRKLIRLWLNLSLNFSVIPLRLSTVIGLCMSFMGGVAGLLTFIDYLITGEPVAGWTSLILTILLFSGFQMIMLGVIGEYLGRLYLSENNKPQSIIREVISVDSSESENKK